MVLGVRPCWRELLSIVHDGGKVHAERNLFRIAERRPSGRAKRSRTQVRANLYPNSFYLTFARKSAKKRAGVKFKDIFPAVCVVLLIISEFFLFSANHQKGAAQARLAEAQRQVEDLQGQFIEFTNAIIANESDALVRLKAGNADLPRLRSQIQQLQLDNTKLLQELNIAREALGQRQEQLQEIEAQDAQDAQNQQAQAQAVEQAVAQTETQERNACIANLRLIYAAKQAWALDKSKTDSDLPTEQDLLPYLKGGVFPVCPSGGVYSIGSVGQPPTCSISGHVLPPQ